MSLVTTAGNPVTLGRKLKEGGEGAVYICQNSPGFLVKIYHKQPSPDKILKLTTMAKLVSPDLVSIAAWPTHLVFDDRRRSVPVGLLMPYLQGKEIHTLYSPHDRKSTFPFATWDFLIHVAKNVAAAFETLHSNGIVMGDVNEGNFLVNEKGMVGLIDCDSYQLPVINGRRFLCEVGIALWTPPELQGRSFNGVVRDPNHDTFGLALLIFYLLFMGRHPFAGVPKRGQDITIEDAIKNRVFAYSMSQPHPDFRPPSTGFLLDKVPTYISSQFDRAFLSDINKGQQRPSAKEWFNVLATLQKEIAACQYDKGHKFHSALRDCPWCAIRDRGGPNFFISVGTDTLFVLNLDRCRMLYDQIKRAEPINSSLPEFMSFPHFKPRVLPPSIPPAPRGPSLPPLRGPAWVCAALGLALQVCSFVFLLPDLVLLMVGGIVVGFAAIIAAMRELNGFVSDHKKFRAANVVFENLVNARNNMIHDCRNQIQALQNEVAEVDSVLIQERKNFDGAAETYRADLKRIKAAGERTSQRVTALPGLYSKEWAELEAKKMNRLFQKHLEKYQVRHATIPGIGENKKAMLAAYGIETADDVRRNIEVPGFGEVLIQRLLAWREACERQFTFQGNEPNDPQDVRAFSVKFKGLQQALEADLGAKVAEIDTLHDFNCRRVAQMQKIWREALEKKARCLQDIAVLNSGLQAADSTGLRTEEILFQCTS